MAKASGLSSTAAEAVDLIERAPEAPGRDRLAEAHQHADHGAQQGQQRDHRGITAARARRQHHARECPGQRQHRETLQHQERRQPEVQLAERRAQHEHRQQRRDRPVDLPPDAVAQRVARQPQEQQRARHAPVGLVDRAADQQLRTDRQGQQPEHQRQGRGTPAEPQAERQREAAEQDGNRHRALTSRSRVADRRARRRRRGPIHSMISSLC
jgi:hypothetical protein